MGFETSSMTIMREIKKGYAETTGKICRPIQAQLALTPGSDMVWT